MPPIDFYLMVVDTLAKRYGWSWTEISENMYWEYVYELYEFASNLDTIEKNEQMKFQFMMHAQSKEAINKWKDALIPFPDRAWKPPKRKTDELDLSINFSRHKNVSKMSPEQKERYDIVKQKLEVGRKKALEEKRKYYYGN